MKLIAIEQNTPEWLEMRRTKIGASDCAIIMRESPYKTPIKLWEEKVQGKSSGYHSAAMQRGHDLEPVARALAEKLHNTCYRPVCVQHPEHEWMIASLDGYDPIHENIIEIKIPNQETFAKISYGEIPVHYEWQMQHQMAVTGLKKAFLFAYHEGRCTFHTIERDETKIEQLIEAELRFYERMINFDPPEEIAVDTELRTDDEFYEAELAWKEAYLALKEAEEQEKICREGLIYLAQDKPTRGRVAYVEKCSGRTTVEYKKIPQLEGVDLKPYERKGSPYWKVREAR